MGLMVQCVFVFRKYGIFWGRYRWWKDGIGVFKLVRILLSETDKVLLLVTNVRTCISGYEFDIKVQTGNM